MVQAKVYVHEDPHGALRIAATDVSLDSVVIGYQEGHSAETIQQLYPALSLEDVYGAIAYYLANPTEVHEYLDRQAQVWVRARAESKQEASPVVKRLRAIRKRLYWGDKPWNRFSPRCQAECGLARPIAL